MRRNLVGERSTRAKAPKGDSVLRMLCEGSVWAGRLGRLSAVARESWGACERLEVDGALQRSTHNRERQWDRSGWAHLASSAELPKMKWLRDR